MLKLSAWMKASRPEEGEIEVAFVLFSYSFTYAISLIPGRYANLARAIEMANAIVPNASLAYSLACAPILVKKIPRSLMAGASLPSWDFLVGNEIEEDTPNVLSSNYYLNKIRYIPELYPQISGNYLSISLSLCFCLIAEYKAEKAEIGQETLPGEDYIPVVDALSPDLQAYQPISSYWENPGLIVASDTDFYYEHPQYGYVIGFEWAWQGQILPYYHCINSIKPGFLSYVDDLMLFRWTSESPSPGDLYTIGDNSACYDSIFDFEWDSYISGGRLVTWHRISLLNAYRPSIPALYHRTELIPTVTKSTTVMPLFLWGGALLGKSLSVGDFDLKLAEKTITINGKILSVRG